MASDVEIVNLALSHLGSTARINSLTEDSEEAHHARLVYAKARDALLRGHAWRFATSYQTLASLGDPPTHWDYSYQYPNNCLRALEIVTLVEGDDPVPFEVALAPSGDSRVILCDLPQAQLKYIARVTNPNLYDPNFVVALSWLLAVELAAPLTGDKERMQLVTDTYQRAVSAAAALDANEAHRDLNRDADHIRARL
jgi:hypothetical protein